MTNPTVNTMEEWESTQQERFLSKLPNTPEKRVKALLNWDGLMVWDTSVDPVDMLRAYLKRCHRESCGQCIPCYMGTKQMSQLINRLISGQGNEKELDQIDDLAKEIRQSARCDIGKTLAKPINDLISEYRQDFLDVIENKRQITKGTYQFSVTAPCISACPSHVDVPGYIEGIRVGNYEEAMKKVREDCPMPGTIGRVCVRPCEANCRRGALDEPVSIRALKRFLADHEIKTGTFPQKPDMSAKSDKVAIVGAGPAGLSCAYYLGKMGYQCDIYEARERGGGMATFGIPDYRLPPAILKYEISVVEAMGATIHYNTRIGDELSIEELTQSGYKSIFIGVGAPESSKMRCEGEDAGYMCFMTGVTFLAEAARNHQPLEGKKLLVIGGGNVAMDCVRTAKRYGFTDVNLLYRRTEHEMPADPQEIKEAKEEGVIFHHLVAPVRVVAENNQVKGLECLKMELGEPDDSGRRRPVPVEGSNFVIECDAIIPAVGQTCIVDCVVPNKDILTDWKTLVVDETTFQSKQEPVFGGGDCITGPDTLIAALAAGKNAARFMDQYIRNGKCQTDLMDTFTPLISQMSLFDPNERFGYPGVTHREHPVILKPEERITHFDEVEKGYSEAQAMAEAERCLRCYRIVMTAL